MDQNEPNQNKLEEHGQDFFECGRKTGTKNEDYHMCNFKQVFMFPLRMLYYGMVKNPKRKFSWHNACYLVGIMYVI